MKRRALRDRASAPRRSWARILAFSIGIHVVLLGVVALLLRNDAPTTDRAGVSIALDDRWAFDPEPDPVDTELAKFYPNVEWRDVAQISDELVLREQEAYRDDELPDVFSAVPSGMPGAPTPRDGRGAGASFDQPVGVVIAATRRRDPALKRRRLDLLGFNATGTLRAVEKGLAYLAPRQNEDGSFPVGSESDGRTEIEQTAIVLLTFLGDGHCSHAPSGQGHGAVVGKGVRWLRDQLFNASRNDAERAAHLAEHDVSVLGPATVALCEDYMLSYGWLSPAAAEARAREIAELAGRLQKGTAASVSHAVEQPWAVWGLDAASRVGVVGATAEDMRVFRQWVLAASGAKRTLSAMSFLSVGTALLFSERGAQKPRFLEWSRENAPLLARRLGPHGYVRSGDAVGETALILLGLQVAYRTY